MRILVVEDDNTIVRNIQQIFHLVFPNAFDIQHIVATVADAKRAVRNIHPEVCIIDISLPDGSGFDIMSGEPLLSEIPLICITGLPPDAIIHDIVQSRVFKYLPKPFTADQFTDALTAALEVARQKRQGDILKAAGDTIFFQMMEEIAVLKQQLAELTTDSNRTETDAVRQSLLKSIDIDTGKAVITVQKEDIFLIEVWGNYVNIYTLSRTSPLVERRTIKHYEQLLETHGFISVNRGALVRTAAILSLHNGTAVLPNNKTVSIAQRRKKAVEEAFWNVQLQS